MNSALASCATAIFAVKMSETKAMKTTTKRSIEHSPSDNEKLLATALGASETRLAYLAKPLNLTACFLSLSLPNVPLADRPIAAVAAQISPFN